jgi:hypothetical protein
MRCKKGKLCQNFILSTSVTVVGTSLVVNIPTLPSVCGCIVIAQAIPDAATVNMPVVITIGTSATQYPLVDKCGVQLSAGRLDVRYRYPFRFITANTASIFKVCGARCPYNVIPGAPVITG